MVQISVSLLLIVAGSGLLLWGQSQKMVVAAKPSPQPWQSSDFLTKPVKLYIPKMKRVLSVGDGFVEDGRWAISSSGVSYLTSSALPGQGNTVIYGHNTQGILGSLWQVQDGDWLYVVLASGDFVKYQIFQRKEIDPSQVTILAPTAGPRLTIYTCSGFLDAARFVVVGKLI